MSDKFPKVLVLNRETGKSEFIDFFKAAARQNLLFEAWDIQDQVLEEDFSTRKITRDEINNINYISDELDASR